MWDPVNKFEKHTTAVRTREVCPMLWIYCTTSCTTKSTTNLQQIEPMYNKSATFHKILQLHYLLSDDTNLNNLLYNSSTTNPQLFQQVDFGLKRWRRAVSLRQTFEMSLLSSGASCRAQYTGYSLSLCLSVCLSVCSSVSVDPGIVLTRLQAVIHASFTKLVISHQIRNGLFMEPSTSDG